MAETPRLAHLGVLLFLASGFAVMVCLIAALAAAVSKARRMARLAVAAAGVCAGAYVLLLLGVGALTPDRTLRSGEWKYFCEADCHIAYSIVDVKYAASIGPEANPLTTRGQFAVVRLKTWFDEHSIAPWRGDSPLTPDLRMVKIVDKAGHGYAPITKPVELPETKRSRSIREPLSPGESYETTFVFELPPGVANPRFLITDEDPDSRLLVDHENSPLHGKIYLGLDPTLPASAANRR